MTDVYIINYRSKIVYQLSLEIRLYFVRQPGNLYGLRKSLIIRSKIIQKAANWKGGVRVADTLWMRIV